MAIHVPVLLVMSQLFLDFTPFSSAADTISQSQSLRDGSTLVSKDGIFELGFFTPGTSPNRYLGIWYKNIPNQTVVWVANRENPITTVNSSLSINREGNLLILSKSESVIWSTNSTEKAISPILQLLDSGNLVLREQKDENPQNYMWQSFGYPTDTLLPEMKLGWNLRTGLNRRLSAWSNSEDPSPGDFTWGFELSSIPEMAMLKGSEKFYRDGPWNGIQFSGSSQMTQNPLLDCQFVNSKDEFYYTFSLKNKSLIARIALNQSSYSRLLYMWDEEEKTWKISSSVPRDSCDKYNACGSNGYCAMDDQTHQPTCRCLMGFATEPQWLVAEEKGNCARITTLGCGVTESDGFLKLNRIKVPATKVSWVNESMTLEQCKDECSKNCSCTAYTSSDIRGEGSGCALWFGDLIDVRQNHDAGQDLYIRLSANNLSDVQDAKDDHKRKVAVISISITVSFILVMLSTFSFIYWHKRKLRNTNDEGEQEDFELPLFDLDTITRATDNFSSANKLGQGGFGPVYKGTLVGGKEIAVKRLSKRSEQGLEEFKNEVKLCAKLQHRNLVKVLGWCIQKDEKLLIYEYMHNKSLDWFLFDPTRSKLLDWSQRFHIIYGIARGLLYLHQDSRLRIIHRDLKASNILLDKELNPKISDFGLARNFGGDEIEGNTRKVAGTLGYMAPEYVIDGLFSIKSDVFSFGILLLEIISGKKNKSLSYANHGLTLIGHAWRLWKEDVPLELLDPCLKDSCVVSEVLRCIHIGLLCVQQHPHDRPNMASVVVMLNNESTLPRPKEPGFFLEKTSAEDRLSSGIQKPFSNSEITLSILDPR